jgi:hypothetical protein
VTLDERGWKEISRELSSMLARVEKIQEASIARLKKADHAGQVRGTVVMALLETLAAPDAPPKDLAKSRRR